MTTPDAPPVSPGPPPPSTAQDTQHLKVLAILYYVYGGLISLFSCLGIAYIGAGVALWAFRSEIAESEPELTEEAIGALGWMMGAGGVVVVLMQLALGAMAVYTGRCLATRRHRVLCLVIAAIICLSVPIGTALGIFTIVVLTRPGVVAMFGVTEATIR